WMRQTTLASATIKLKRAAPGSDDWTEIASPDPQATAVLDTQIAEGASYVYRLSYVADQIESLPVDAYSNAVTVLPPTDLSATFYELGVRLNWRNQSKLATGVVVSRNDAVDN